MAKRSYEANKMPKVKWPLEDDLPFLYSNNFALLVTENEVVLEFGSFLPTGFTGRSQTEINNYLGKATVKPLAKVVLSKEGFRIFADMINKKINIDHDDTQDLDTGLQISEEEASHD